MECLVLNIFNSPTKPIFIEKDAPCYEGVEQFFCKTQYLKKFM